VHPRQAVNQAQALGSWPFGADVNQSQLSMNAGVGADAGGAVPARCPVPFLVGPSFPNEPPNQPE
jgi:hypothetical protein